MDQSSPDLAVLLRDVLSLPAHERQRLVDVVQGVAPTPQPRATVAQAVPSPAQTQEQELEHDQQLQQWLDAIHAEEPWKRLQLLNAALEQADSEQEVSVLEGAKRSLLDSNPPLAMRRAVVEVATNHPFGIAIGAAGIVLAIVAIGRGAFRLMF